MNLDGAFGLAAGGRLYPSVILHGGRTEARQTAVVHLARILLCEAAPDGRPCGECKHCRRIAWPEEGERFHPDFQVLMQDLKTVTSVGATREWLRTAQVAPYEARGQVFVIAAAATLSAEAANALLKALEEPHLTAPRNFFLLCPSQFELLPTLRSRSLAVYLGSGAELEAGQVEEIATAFAALVAAWNETGAPIHLLGAAAALAQAGGWEDPRSGTPWNLAATAVVAAMKRAESPGELAAPLLALSADLLDAHRMRVRGITAIRILEGLVSRHLAASAPASG